MRARAFKALAFGLALGLAAAASAESYVKVVAKVGKDIVTDWDVEEAVLAASADMTDEERASAAGKAKLAALHKDALDGIVRQKLVVQSALNQGAEGKDGKEGDKGPAARQANRYIPGDEELEEQVTRELDRRKAAAGGEREFTRELERQHMTEAAFKGRLRERVRENMIFLRLYRDKQKEFQGGLTVSPAEAEKYYQAHRDEFSTGRQALLRLILCATEADAEKLRKKLDNGADFADLARANSKDEATAGKGGLVGWVEEGQIEEKAVDQAAFAAGKGKVAGPVRGRRGWTLLLVEDMKAPEGKDFAAVRQQVMNKLFMQRLNDKMDEWVKGLKSKSYVDISE